MKIKKFGQFNESVRDMLKPKELDNERIVEHSFEMKNPNGNSHYDIICNFNTILWEYNWGYSGADYLLSAVFEEVEDKAMKDAMIKIVTKLSEDFKEASKLVGKRVRSDNKWGPYDNEIKMGDEGVIMSVKPRGVATVNFNGREWTIYLKHKDYKYTILD